MVKRFHCQFKAALKARANLYSWMDALPLVLLGIRMSLKEDIFATAAEMVCITTFQLPRKFFNPSPKTSVPDPSDYMSQLRDSLQHIRPVSPCLTQPHSKVVDGLSTATHVFLRHDAVLKPLQTPFDGPYQVLKHIDKHFTLDIKDHRDTVSVDHLKPAHINQDIPHITPPMQLRPPHLLGPLSSPVDMFTSQSTSHHLCRNTLGGGGCSELNLSSLFPV